MKHSPLPHNSLSRFICIAWCLSAGTAFAESIVLEPAAQDASGQAAAEGNAPDGATGGEEARGKDVEPSEEQREEARVHFVAGSDYFSKGEYDKAIPEFQKAYAVVFSPEILYNIGRCYEELGKEQEAIYNYEMYLRLYPNAEDAEDVHHRITILKDVKAVEAKRAEASVSVSSDAVEADGETQSSADYEEEFVEDEKWFDGLRIAAELGVDVPVVGPWERVLVPAHLAFHLPLQRWLQLTATGILGVGASKDKESNFHEVRGIVGVFIGLRFLVPLKHRFELFFRLGGDFMGLARERYNRMTLFVGGQGAIGFTVNITPEWRLVVESTTDGGVILPGVFIDNDTWGSKGLAKATVAIGGMVGMEFSF